MDKAKLIEKLKELKTEFNEEIKHSKADDLLLKFINIPQITEAFNELIKEWN